MHPGSIEIKQPKEQLKINVGCIQHGIVRDHIGSNCVKLCQIKKSDNQYFKKLGKLSSTHLANLNFPVTF